MTPAWPLATVSRLMSGVSEVLGALLEAGATPQIAAYHLGCEIVEDAGLKGEMYVLPFGAGAILLRPGKATEVTARAWMGLIWILCERLGVRLSDEERAGALLDLLERGPKKSVSGFLVKTGS